MKFQDFISKYSTVPVIDSRSFTAAEVKHGLRKQVQRWVHKQYLTPLKRGMYVLNAPYRKHDAAFEYIANLLVIPSYVSLTYALGHYRLIPEQATVITSVTSKKTRTFANDLGRFEYRSIRQSLFNGYQRKIIGTQKVFIASPEKALLDYFYYFSERDPGSDYFESLRLQNTEILNKEVISNYMGEYNKRVDSVINSFLAYLDEEKDRYQAL